MPKKSRNINANVAPIDDPAAIRPVNSLLWATITKYAYLGSVVPFLNSVIRDSKQPVAPKSKPNNKLPAIKITQLATVTKILF